MPPKRAAKRNRQPAKKDEEIIVDVPSDSDSFDDEPEMLVSWMAASLIDTADGNEQPNVVFDPFISINGELAVRIVPTRPLSDEDTLYLPYANPFRSMLVVAASLFFDDDESFNSEDHEFVSVDEEEPEPAPKRAKKSPAKKSPAKRGPGRPPKKSPAKSSPAKRGPGRPAKKSPAKKSPAKKSPAKKSPAKKSPAKKSPAAAKSPAKRGPGRPPKSAKSSPAKRGPGRPPKKSPAKRSSRR